MDYTKIPRCLLYRDQKDAETFNSLHPLNEILIDNMNEIEWMREGDFEARATSCLNTAYYICMVMRKTSKPEYKTSWCYQKASKLNNDDSGLDKLVTMALVLQLIEHSDKKWAKVHAGFIKRLNDDLVNLWAVRELEVAGFGIPFPSSLPYSTISKAINRGTEKSAPLPDTFFEPIPILEGIRNTIFYKDLYEGLSYVEEQIRKLESKEVQQQCVDACMHCVQGPVVYPWEKNTIDMKIEELCKELNLKIPDKILTEKETDKDEPQTKCDDSLQKDKRNEEQEIETLRRELADFTAWEEDAEIYDELWEKEKTTNHQKLVFFLSVFGISLDKDTKKFYNQKVLAGVISCLTGEKPSTIGPMITRIISAKDRIARNKSTEADQKLMNTLAAAAQFLNDKLGEVMLETTRDDKSQKINKLREDLMLEFPWNEND